MGGWGGGWGVLENQVGEWVGSGLVVSEGLQATVGTADTGISRSHTNYWENTALKELTLSKARHSCTP